MRLHLAVLSVVGIALLIGCGPSRPAARSARPAASASPEPAATPEARPKRAFDGPTVLLGQETEIMGFKGVGVRGADYVVVPVKTKWMEVEVDGRPFREGHADLSVDHDGKTEKVRIDVGERKAVGGYEIEVTFVGDGYDDLGRTVPHVKLVFHPPKP